MGYVIAQLWPWMLLSGAIGIATGWWMWRSPAEADEPIAAPYIPPAPPQDEPLPEIDPEPETPPQPEPAPAFERPAGLAEEAEAQEIENADPVVEEEAPTTSPFLDAPDGEPDDLTRIKGIGPKLNDVLHAMGVYHFDQIARWSATDIAEVDARLDTFQGRIERDRWVEQAGYLASNDMVSFRREFGKPRGEL